MIYPGQIFVTQSCRHPILTMVKIIRNDSVRDQVLTIERGLMQLDSFVMMLPIEQATLFRNDPKWYVRAVVADRTSDLKILKSYVAIDEDATVRFVAERRIRTLNRVLFESD